MSEQESVPGSAGQGAEGTPPASPPAAPPAPAPETPPPAPFFQSIKDPTVRGYVEAKGYKQTDPVEFAEALAKSYQNLEKLRGVPAERLLQLPESLDDAEAMKPIYARLGMVAPEKPGDYGFSAMEGVEPVQAGKLAEIAHRHNVPPKMAQAVMAEVAKLETETRTAMMAEVVEAVSVEKGQLQAEWGAKYESNVEAGKRAARRFGLDETTIAAFEENVGYAATMKFFKAVGDAMGEASFVEGERRSGGFNGMTPEGARAKRDQLMSDKEFAAKMLAGDKSVREQVQRLNMIIAGGS